MGQRRVLRVFQRPEHLWPVVVTVRPDVHQAGQQDGQADQQVPDGFEAGQAVTGKVRNLVDEQGRAEQAETGCHGTPEIGRRPERLLQTQPEGGPAYACGQQQIAPIDGGARSDASGEPFAQ